MERPAKGPTAPARRDWLLFGAGVATALVEAALRPELPGESVALGIVLMPTLVWRRTRPLLMVAIAFGVAIMTGAAELVSNLELPELHSTAFLVLLPYALVRWASWRQVAIGSAVIASAAAMGFIARNAAAGDVFGGTAVLLAVMAIGVAVRYRARTLSQEIEQAKLLEREQIARDLHDSVAHHMSAIAIRAQSGIAVSGEQGAGTEALRDIEAEASRALADLRSIVHVLRRSRPAELAPAPGIAEIARLAQSRTDGPDVDISISGELDGLSSSVSSAIYRIAQEALTNSLRHATNASRIDIEVSVDDASVRLLVRDDGVTSASSAGARSGFGLIGMKERAEMLGGSLEAGAEIEKGWQVMAVLPRHTPDT